MEYQFQVVEQYTDPTATVCVGAAELDVEVAVEVLVTPLVKL